MSCVEKVSHLLQLLCHFASTTPFTAILGLQRLLTCMHYPLRCVANMRQYKYIPSPDSNQQCHGILAPPRNGKGEKTCILLHPNLAELNMSKKLVLPLSSFAQGKTCNRVQLPPCPLKPSCLITSFLPCP